MALTSSQRLDTYRFFSIAFGAAPGTTYHGQMEEAYSAGLTTKQIVNIFTTKWQFQQAYAPTLSTTDFANLIVENVVAASATDSAKTAAKKDIVEAIGIGWSRGDIIYQLFSNLASKSADDTTWGGTSKLMQNRVDVAQYATEILGMSTTDLTTIQNVIKGVTAATDTSTTDAIKTVLTTAGISTSLAAVALTSGNDTYTAPVGTAAVAVNGGIGNDTITGADGNDQLYGGSGDDTINGGKGKDYIEGGDGADTVYLGWGDVNPDTADGGAGDDSIFGSFGSDTIYGGDGNDVLWGEDRTGWSWADFLLSYPVQDVNAQLRSLSDTIYGGAGNDKLYGGKGDDRLYGGDGDDTIYGGDTMGFGLAVANVDVDFIDAGAGADVVIDFVGASITVLAGAGNDAIDVSVTTTGARSLIDGGEGDDYMTVKAIGTNGKVDVVAGEGRDELFPSFYGEAIFSIDLKESAQAKDIVNEPTFSSSSGLKPDVPAIVSGFDAATDVFRISRDTNFNLYGLTYSYGGPAIGSGTVVVQDGKVTRNLVQVVHSPSEAFLTQLSGGGTDVHSYGKGVFLVSDAQAADSSAATVAAFLDSYGANATYVAKASHIFGVNVRGQGLGLYRFTDDGAGDATVTAIEVRPMVLLTGVYTEQLDTSVQFFLT